MKVEVEGRLQRCEVGDGSTRVNAHVLLKGKVGLVLLGLGKTWVGFYLFWIIGN